MNADDARTIGRRLRQIRRARGKSLVVIAGLAGMSKSQLDRIERGEVALDRLSEIVALANGHTDSPPRRCGWRWTRSTEHPGGLVLPVAVLRDRVA